MRAYRFFQLAEAMGSKLFGRVVERMWIRSFAESLGTMTYIFRTDCIGYTTHEAMAMLTSTWNGSQAERIDASKFWVKNRGRLDPFTFFFIADSIYGEDGDPAESVKLVVTRADPPFENVMLLTDKTSTNYVIRTTPKELTRQERRLCKALERHGRIPRGKTPMPDGQVLVEFMDFSRSPNDALWDSVSGGRL